MAANVDDVIDGIISDLVDGLIDLPDDEIDAKLAEYDLDPEDVADIKDLITAERMADTDAEKNPLSLENVDKMADAAAEMSASDGTPVKVTEQDKDNDGDPDKVTIEKDEPNDDTVLGKSEKESLPDVEDEPHDKNLVEDEPKEEPENSSNAIAQVLASHRW